MKKRKIKNTKIHRELLDTLGVTYTEGNIKSSLSVSITNSELKVIRDLAEELTNND